MQLPSQIPFFYQANQYVGEIKANYITSTESSFDLTNRPRDPMHLTDRNRQLLLLVKSPGVSRERESYMDESDIQISVTNLACAQSMSGGQLSSWNHSFLILKVDGDAECGYVYIFHTVPYKGQTQLTNDTTQYSKPGCDGLKENGHPRE